MSILLESKLEGFSDKSKDIVRNSPLIRLVEESESKKVNEWCGTTIHVLD